MSISNTYCQDCGTLLNPEAAEGFCARCLLSSAIYKDDPPSLVPLDPKQVEIPYTNLTAVLGVGAMGTVFRARQTRLQRDVAVKVIAPHLSRDPEFVERLFREAQAMAILNHPSIVGIYEIGETAGGELYLVMELVEGHSLRDRIAKGPIPPRESIRIAQQICHALEYAHGRGVIHRDIKPSNILIDRDENARLADFGIAQLIERTDDEALTSTRSSIGTPEYIAPEQLDNAEIQDHRVDIYSLGVTFYQMLTGVMPRGMWYWPSKFVDGVDKRFDKVIDQVLQNDPKKRYQNAKELETDLRKLLVKPTRVAAWIFVVISLAIIGLLSFHFVPREPVSESVITEDGEIQMIEPNWYGAARPWLSPAVWGNAAMRSPEVLANRDFVTQYGIDLKNPIPVPGQRAIWPGRSLRLVPGSSIELWGSGNRVEVKSLILDGGTVSCWNGYPSPQEEYPEMIRAVREYPNGSIQVWLSGDVLVNEPSQIDLGCYGENRLQLIGDFAGSAPVFIPRNENGSRVTFMGENEQFTGGMHIMGTAVCGSPNALGSGPVLIDSGLVEIACRAKLGDVEINNRGRVDIRKESIFTSLRVDGKVIPPGFYNQSGPIKRSAAVQGIASYHVLQLPPKESFDGALIPSSLSKISPTAWKGLPPSDPEMTFTIADREVLGCRRLRGIHQFPGRAAVLKSGGSLVLQPLVATVIFPDLRLQGGKIAIQRQSSVVAGVLAGNLTVVEDSEILMEPPSKNGLTRLRVWGNLRGAGTLVFRGSNTDKVLIGAETDDFTGRIEVVNAELSPTRSDIFRDTEIVIDGGYFFNDYRLAPRVSRIELKNGARLRLRANYIEVGKLVVEGTEIKPGVYNDEPWIKSEHPGAIVHVGADSKLGPMTAGELPVDPSNPVVSEPSKISEN